MYTWCKYFITCSDGMQILLVASPYVRCNNISTVTEVRGGGKVKSLRSYLEIRTVIRANTNLVRMYRKLYKIGSISPSTTEVVHAEGFHRCTEKIVHRDLWNNHENGSSYSLEINPFDRIICKGQTYTFLVLTHYPPFKIRWCLSILYFTVYYSK